MGIFEKRKFRSLLMYIQQFNIEDPKTWNDLDPKTSTTKDMFRKYNVDDNTQDVCGHALALYRSEA
jgi:Rab GDP dissociation inhibitor